MVGRVSAFVTCTEEITIGLNAVLQATRMKEAERTNGRGSLLVGVCRSFWRLYSYVLWSSVQANFEYL